MLSGSGLPLTAVRITQAARLRAILPALASMKHQPAKYHSARRVGVKVDEIVLHATESGGDQAASLRYLSPLTTVSSPFILDRARSGPHLLEGAGRPPGPSCGDP